MEVLCKKDGNGITFENTAPGTPQQNVHADQKFAMLFGQVRLMLNGGNFIDHQRCILWAKAANTATKLENCILKTGNEMSAF